MTNAATELLGDENCRGISFVIKENGAITIWQNDPHPEQRAVISMTTEHFAKIKEAVLTAKIY